MGRPAEEEGCLPRSMRCGWPIRQRSGQRQRVARRPGAALRVLGHWTAAQDVAQDVFVELWSHPDRYDPAAGSLRTYLTVLARRRAIDVVRSELRRIARQERNHRLTPHQGIASPSDEAEAAEAAGVVRAAVRLL